MCIRDRENTMEMNREVVVTCAVTGAGDTVGKHPDVPVAGTGG